MVLAATGKHLDIQRWLETLELGVYKGMFQAYSGVESMLHLTEADIKQLGVKNGGHRAVIMSSLGKLRDKYDKGRRGFQHSPASSKSPSPSHVSPPSPVAHPDYVVPRYSPSPESMSAELEAELSGDLNELRSQAWYHGSIPRQKAETMLQNNGEFLVRDCVSQPGDFVLSCCSYGTPLHFIINARLVEREYGLPPVVYYQFEEERYTSIQQLIQNYCGSRKPITQASGAVMSSPIKRTMPLSYYDTKFGSSSNLNPKYATYTPSGTPRASPFRSPSNSPRGSPWLSRRAPQRSGSIPVLLDDRSSASRSPSPLVERCESLPRLNAADEAQQKTGPPDFTGVPRYQRSGSEPMLTPTPTNCSRSFGYSTPPLTSLTPSSSESRLNETPPPKPSRVPSVKYRQRPLVVVRNKDLYEDESERDYSDYDTIKSAPSWATSDSTKPKSPPYDNNFNEKETSKQDVKTIEISPHMMFRPAKVPSPRSTLERVKTSTPPGRGKSLTPERVLDDSGDHYSVPRERSESPMYDVPQEVIRRAKHEVANNTHGSSTKDNRGSDDYVYDINFMHSRRISIPQVSPDISHNALTFNTQLLPMDNKLLDPTAMLRVKSLLLQGIPRSLARHFTKVDAMAVKVLMDEDLGVGVQSGLELITLPQGKQLRQDLLERSHCMALFVVTTILTCLSVSERSRMLSQWIQIAMELRTSMGDLFGFSIVLEGVMSQQILRLQDTWLLLRQNHTSSAFLFDTKLRTFYKTPTANLR